MKELDLLKKDWQKKDKDFPKLTFDEIYILIHKKSSSIVKWIFIIGIIEFAFWGLINLFVPESAFDLYEKFHLKTILYFTYIIHYIIIVGFLVVFYRNYKQISVIDSTKILMQKILNTRKTVNYYIYYNIGMYILLTLVFNIVMFSQPDVLKEVYSLDKTSLNPENLYTLLITVQVIVLLLMCGLLWLFYRVLYGFLLKRLKNNYKELKNLE